jgi:RHS repeat-associated protein
LATYSTGEFYQYAYDPVGNRQSLTTHAGVVNYQYDAANRLTSVNGQAYTWDNNGNPSTGSGQATGAGDRVAKTVDGLTTAYVLDPAAGLTQVLQETTAGQTTSYLYGHDLLAQYDSGTWAYHLNDGLGSVRQLANPVGQVVQGYSFSPFGVPLDESGGEPYGFTGEQWDASAGLVYLRARYYDPGVGRFVSKDPWPGDAFRPRSLASYVYVENNPCNLVDLTGFRPKGPEEIGEGFVAEGDRKGQFEYSCNCGWIDWGHALPGAATTIMGRLEAEVDWDKYIDLRWTGLRGIRVMSGVGKFGIVLPLVEEIALVREESISTNLVPIAVGIYMEHSVAFEEAQSQKWYKRVFGTVGGVLGQPGAGQSGFSEEDLPSNIIGFWIAIEMRRGISYRDAVDEVRDICGAVGKDKSIEVYENEYDNGAGFIEDWKSWEPRFVELDETRNETCSGDLCAEGRKWPTEFSSLTNMALSSQMRGTWWWYVNRLELELHDTSDEGIYAVTLPVSDFW